MSAEQIAKVLDEHPDWIHVGDSEIVHCLSCTWEAVGVDISDAPRVFRAHQAAALSPLFAEARAETLRDAANHTPVGWDFGVGVNALQIRPWLRSLVKHIVDEKLRGRA